MDQQFLKCLIEDLSTYSSTLQEAKKEIKSAFDQTMIELEAIELCVNDALVVLEA